MKTSAEVNRRNLDVPRENLLNTRQHASDRRQVRLDDAMAAVFRQADGEDSLSMFELPKRLKAHLS